MLATPSQVTAILAAYVDPFLNQDLVSARVVQEIAVKQDGISLKLHYPYPLARQISQLKQDLSKLFHDFWPELPLSLHVEWKINRHQAQAGLKHKSGIKNIIAVGSGKGGVGKSTVAANLALALAGQGATVAILDADIYGPSQPTLLGTKGTRAKAENKKLNPIAAYGIQTMSIANLVEDESPMIWRGPMVSSALQQLLNETAWEPCDYLILDLPPGTGDIQLTMAQKLPISGAVIVTTPQEVATIDASKAVRMFEKVGIPVLGLVENMSWHACSQCQHQENLFGFNGGVQMASKFNLPILAQLPLHSELMHASDQGKPIVSASPDSPLAQFYWEMALKVAGQLAQRPIDYTLMTPIKM